jgi:hypothetical protein
MRRFRCPISAIGGCGCRCCSAAACRAHLCTIADFVALARSSGAKIEQANALDAGGRVKAMQPDALMRGIVGGPNLFAQGAIFLLKKN